MIKRQVFWWQEPLIAVGGLVASVIRLSEDSVERTAEDGVVRETEGH